MYSHGVFKGNEYVDELVKKKKNPRLHSWPSTCLHYNKTVTRTVLRMMSQELSKNVLKHHGKNNKIQYKAKY